MLDYNKQEIVEGDCIRSIETGWHGKIEATEMQGGDYLMLRCKGINFWTSEVDEDDTQWFSPDDVVKASPKRSVNDPVNMANVL